MLTDPLGLKPALDMASPNHGGGVSLPGHYVEGRWVSFASVLARAMGKGNSGDQLAQQMERGIAQSRIYNFINAALAGYGGKMDGNGATYYGASNRTSSGGERGTQSGGVFHSAAGFVSTVSVTGKPGDSDYDITVYYASRPNKGPIKGPNKGLLESWTGGMGIYGPVPIPFPGPYGSPYPGMAPDIPSWESLRSWQRAQQREVVHNINELTQKMATEIERIYKRVKGPDGYVYELRVNKGGIYTDVRGNYVDLKAGDIWKYGESTTTSRYSGSELRNMVPGGIKMNVIYEGSQIEIKVFEKFLIYGYYFNHKHLPPGNRIFR